MVFTRQSKKLTTGLCQIYNLHDCKKRNAIKKLQFLQPILGCSLFTTSLSQFLQSLITCDKGKQKIQQNYGGQNNAIKTFAVQKKVGQKSFVFQVEQTMPQHDYAQLDQAKQHIERSIESMILNLNFIIKFCVFELLK